MITGRVYQIVCSEMEEVYVGSTIQTLKERWRCHIKDYKKGDNFSIYPYFKKYGLCKFEIKLIKEYRVVDREHLVAYETLWYNRLNCTPEQTTPFIPLPKDIYRHISHKEYYQENKERIAEYRRENKERIAAKKKEYHRENKERIASKAKEYRDQNKEQLAAQKKEYHRKNKEQLAAKAKEYRKQNKDKISTKRNEKIECECGSEVSRCNLAVHKKSKKHESLMLKKVVNT